MRIPCIITDAREDVRDSITFARRYQEVIAGEPYTRRMAFSDAAMGLGLTSLAFTTDDPKRRERRILAGDALAVAEALEWEQA